MMTIIKPHDNFLINIDKPIHLTSHDVVRTFKRALPREFKIGHLGTLDPFATGVLLVAVNGANRLMELFHEHLPKTYLAVGKLGVKTVTGDLTVPPEETLPVSLTQDLLSYQQLINEKLVGAKGEYWQAPPAYSAAKFQGKALYKWAREGEKIEKPPRLRHLYSVTVLKIEGDEVTFRASVSGGTYIRVLFEDIAKLMGTVGALKELRRESIGSLSSDQSLEQIKWPSTREWDWQINAIPMEKALPLPILRLDAFNLHRYRAGKNVDLSSAVDLNFAEFHLKDHYWVCDQSDKLLGLAQTTSEDLKIIFNLKEEKL